VQLTLVATVGQTGNRMNVGEVIGSTRTTCSLLHFPQDAPNALLGAWLSRLRDCVGATCKQYENGIPPP